MERRMKEQVVAELHEKMKDAAIAIVAEFSGIDVETVTAIRSECRESGVDYKVVKNTLAKRAAKGTPVETIEADFSGPVVLMMGSDPVTPAKLMAKFAKANAGKFVPRSGVAEGAALDAEGLEALSTMPSLEELRGTIAGMIAQPATKLATVLAAPGQQIARVVEANKENFAA